MYAPLKLAAALRSCGLPNAIALPFSEHWYDIVV